jgi:hypothetical protein
MSLWDQVVNVLDLKGDALTESNSSILDQSDARELSSDDVEQLLAELRIEKSNARHLSLALDEEQSKRRNEVLQLKDLLFDKEQVRVVCVLKRQN